MSDSTLWCQHYCSKTVFTSPVCLQWRHSSLFGTNQNHAPKDWDILRYSEIFLPKLGEGKKVFKEHMHWNSNHIIYYLRCSLMKAVCLTSSMTLNFLQMQIFVESQMYTYYFHPILICIGCFYRRKCTGLFPFSYPTNIFITIEWLPLAYI
jgi:hypothetical protein